MDRCPACGALTTNVDVATHAPMLCDACVQALEHRDRDALALTAHPSLRLRLSWMLTRLRVGIQDRRQRRAATRAWALLPFSVPQEYARLYRIEGQAPDEADWQFRLRVARTLEGWGQGIPAREALYNCREPVHALVCGPLDDGYGEAHVTQMARLVEASFQAELRRLHRQQQRQQCTRRLCFWKHR